MLRWIRAAVAVVVLVGIVGGLPWLLLSSPRLWGAALPTSWDGLLAALLRPDDGSLALVLFTVAGWLSWAVLTIAVVSELVARVRRVSVPRWRGFAVPQLIAARLVGAVFAVAAIGGSVVVMPAVAAPVITVAAQPADLAPVSLPQRPAPTVAQRDAHELPQWVTVRKGDTLSELAQEHLGGASQWPRIAKANPTKVRDPDHIEVGWRLKLPATGVAAFRAEPEAKRDQPPATVDRDPAPKEAPVPAPQTPTDGSQGPAVPTLPPAADMEVPEPAEPAATVDSFAPDGILLGALGAMTAAGIAGGWYGRRRLQDRVRPLGRRLPHPAPGLARVQQAVVRRQRLDQIAVVEWVQRRVAAEFHHRCAPLPRLAQILVDPLTLTVEWSEPAGSPPPGFTGSEWAWQISPGDDTFDDPAAGPCAFPALVTLGQTEDGATVMIDLDRAATLGVSGATPELQRGTLVAMALELACAPWAAEVSLTVVGPDAALVALVADHEVIVADIDHAITGLRRQHRRRQPEVTDLRRWRVDPERAEAVRPEVFIIGDELTDELVRELDSLLADDLGLAVVLPTGAGEAQWRLTGGPLVPDEVAEPQSVPADVREALSGLFSLASSSETTLAPWWSDADIPPHTLTPSEDAVDIVSLTLRRPQPPLLRLIGPVDLLGATGPEPVRSRAQLLEMCGWLLEYPGRMATQMAAAMAIAESTRRSNMSRLRSWLGTDEDGDPYLPDAYSGRIRLHPAVTSDVAQLAQLTGPGLTRVGDGALIAALEMVRGEVLADVAPGQWIWADELRSDTTAALRDVALVLAGRALERGDLAQAEWAARQGQLVASADELIMGLRIRVEHRLGNHQAVERLVARLTQQARALEVDLLPETVELCQQVVEGRLRLKGA